MRLVVPTSSPHEAIQRYTVLILLSSARLIRLVTRVLRASEIEVIACSDLDSARECIASNDVGLIVSDVDSHPEELLPLGATLAPMSSPPIIVMSEERSWDRLANLLEGPAGQHVVATFGEMEQLDLLVTARKLLENDLFGIEKYLHWGSVVHSHRVLASPNRSEVLSRLEGFLTELRCGGRLSAQLVTVADELLMNALYDAPTDDQGEHLFADQSRGTPVILPAGHEVELQFGSDGRYVVVSCRDPYGSLRPETIRRRLATCLRRGTDQISQGTGGAGLGLFMTFQFVTHLVVNVDPGKLTEVIGVVEIGRSARQRHERARSFNVFVKRS